VKLGYVCTNYNNSHHTVEAVRSLVLSAGAGHELHVVVVDNRSGPDSVATLRELAAATPCVDLLLNDENVGYFKGLNGGIRRLRERHPDVQHLVIGNNDLLFPPGFCDAVQQQLALFEQHPVVSPDILTLDGEHQNPHVIHTISRKRELVYDLYYASYALALAIRWAARITRTFSDRGDEQQHGVAQPIYQGHGSCYLIGPQFFRHFEELWAPTFLMGEEYFLSKQLSDKGMKTFYTPTIQLTHCCHGSLAALPSRKAWEFARDAHKIYRQHVRVLG